MPTRGVKLDVELNLIPPDQARLMQNCVFDGGVRIREGMGEGTTSALQSDKSIRGGTKYYFGGGMPQSKRIVAYGTNISELSETFTETVLNSGMSDDRDTFFTTWSITDKLYIGNRDDTLRSYDGNTNTFATVTGTNIPIARTGVVPILDRLMCITTNGIERTDPRDDSVWSSNSSWATLRPSQVGLFTALHPYTFTSDVFFDGLLAFQPSAYYLIDGSDFGDDVTAASSSTDNARIRLLKSNVGTSSPYSIVDVPGIGLAFFTTDLNVYLIPEGQLSGFYIGDALRSVRPGDQGIESTALSALDQVWMIYKYPFLRLGFPSPYVGWPDTQFWMDVRVYRQLGPVWYGPMIGQNLRRVWLEDQLSDNAIYGGEGRAGSGAWVYRLSTPGIYTDFSAGVSQNYTFRWRSFFHDFGAPDVEKRIRAIFFDMREFVGNANINLDDIDGQKISNAGIVQFTR